MTTVHIDPRPVPVEEIIVRCAVTPDVDVLHIDADEGDQGPFLNFLSEHNGMTKASCVVRRPQVQELVTALQAWIEQTDPEMTG